MSLRIEQSRFAADTVKLYGYILAQGFEFTYGEAERTEFQQKEYIRLGRSKAAISQHMKRLAIDLNVFKNGELCTYAQMIEIGRFWESLDPKNRWGGSWRGLVEAKKSSFIDTPHFERQG